MSDLDSFFNTSSLEEIDLQKMSKLKDVFDEWTKDLHPLQKHQDKIVTQRIIFRSAEESKRIISAKFIEGTMDPNLNDFKNTLMSKESWSHSFTNEVVSKIKDKISFPGEISTSDMDQPQDPTFPTNVEDFFDINQFDAKRELPDLIEGNRSDRKINPDTQVEDVNLNFKVE